MWQAWGGAAAIDAGIVLMMVRLLKKAKTAQADFVAEQDKMLSSQEKSSTQPVPAKTSGAIGLIARILDFNFFGAGSRKAIGRFRNPVFMAEIRSKLFGRPQFIIRGLSVCLGISMTLLILICWQTGRLDPDDVRVAAVVFQLGIVAVLAPAISSGSITDELTSRTFKMLRMTPISALTVVIGKLKAGFLYVSIFLISSLPVLFSLAYLDVSESDFSLQSLIRVVIWLAILLVTTLVFITAGFCASAFSNNTSGATVVSYTFAAILCIVTFAAKIPGAFTQSVQQTILTFNPVVAAIRVTTSEMYSELNPDIWIHNLAILLGLTVLLVAVSSVKVYRIFTHQA